MPSANDSNQLSAVNDKSHFKSTNEPVASMPSLAVKTFFNDPRTPKFKEDQRSIDSQKKNFAQIKLTEGITVAKQALQVQ
jgi:hypothetical protein